MTFPIQSSEKLSGARDRDAAAVRPQGAQKANQEAIASVSMSVVSIWSSERRIFELAQSQAKREATFGL
jgi:hypothetical protein